MGQASIPVDLFNPGQVFACMGFLEAADILLGYAEGGFDWTNESEARFEVRACGDGQNPFEAVLQFLTQAKLERISPKGYADPPPKSSQGKKGRKQPVNDEAVDPTANPPVIFAETFPAPKGDRLTLPLRFKRDCQALDITHWCDASSRNPFKLFAGLQSSTKIARQMLNAVRKLWEAQKEDLLSDPLGLSVRLGGSSFKFDARKAWTAIDAGYSPDEQTHFVEASPVVEMLAAIGLEHARPEEFEAREVRYGVWKGFLPPVLARPALGGSPVGVPIRVFRFTLDLAGKNKIVTFAQEEANS